MAKREKQVISYPEKIAVNRGEGLKAFQRQQEANTQRTINMLDSYAEKSLKRFQADQELFGQQLALESKLMTKEIEIVDEFTGETKTIEVVAGYPDEKQNEIFTQSAAATFYTYGSKRYYDAAAKDARKAVQTIHTDFSKRIHKFNQDSFKATTDAFKKQFIEGMPENTAERVGKIFDNEVVQHENQLVSKKVAYDNQINARIFTNKMNTLEQQYAENFNNPIKRKQILDEIKDELEYFGSDGLGTPDAVAVEDQILGKFATYDKIYSTITPFMLDDPFNAGLDDKARLIENYKKIDLLLTGNFNKEVDLYDFKTGTIKKIKFSDIISEEPGVDIRKGLRQQITHIRTLIQSDFKESNKIIKGQSNYQLNLSSGIKYMSTEHGDYLDSKHGVEQAIIAYNSSEDIVNNPHRAIDYEMYENNAPIYDDTGNIINFAKSAVISTNLQTQGHPGNFIVNRIKTCLALYDPSCMQEMKDTGILNKLVVNTQVHVSQNKSGEPTTNFKYNVPIMNKLFTDEEVDRLTHFVESNENAEVVFNRYKTFDENKVPLETILSRVTNPNKNKNSNKEPFTVKSFRSFIMDKTLTAISENDEFSNLSGVSDGQKSLISQRVINLTMRRALNRVQAGVPLTSDGLEALVKDNVNFLLNGDTFSFSKYGYAINIPLDTTDDSKLDDRGIFMEYAPEAKYQVGMSSNVFDYLNPFQEKNPLWYVEEKIMDMVKKTPQFADPKFNQLQRPLSELEFGTNIKLIPDRGSFKDGYPQRYQVTYINERDGNQIFLTNKNGEPLMINLYKEREKFIKSEQE